MEHFAQILDAAYVAITILYVTSIAVGIPAYGFLQTVGNSYVGWLQLLFCAFTFIHLARMFAS